MRSSFKGTAFLKFSPLSPLYHGVETFGRLNYSTGSSFSNLNYRDTSLSLIYHRLGKHRFYILNSPIHFIINGKIVEITTHFPHISLPSRKSIPPPKREPNSKRSINLFPLPLTFTIFLWNMDASSTELDYTRGSVTVRRRRRHR